MVKGKTDQAAAVAESSIRKQEPWLTVPSSAAASLYGAAGTAQLKAGDFDKAGMYLQQAIENQGKVSNPTDPVITKWTRDLGTAYSESGKPAKAESTYLLDISLRKRSGDIKGEADTLIELAGFYNEYGQYDKALNSANEALTLTNIMPGNIAGVWSDDSVLALRRLGAAYAGKKEYDEAKTYYDLALDALEKRFGKESPRLLPVLNDLGVLMTQKGTSEAAYEYFVRAYRIQSTAKSIPADAPKILNNFAGIYMRSNDLDSAKDLYQQALMLSPTKAMKMSRDDLAIRNNLGVPLRPAWRQREV